MLFILITASSGLAISSRVRAQDAPTRPLQEPIVETARPVSPTPSESPTPTPQKAPTTAPENSPRENKENAAAKTEETAAKTRSISATTPQKSATKIENKPSPETDKKHEVATVARHPQDSRSVAAKLKAMEKEWETSFNDPAVIQKSLADDFIGTSPDGKSVTKKSLLRAAKESTGAPPTSEAHHLNVYLYGPNTAVVVGGAEETVKNKAGKKVRFNYRFTDTWVEREGNWQCVASQAVLLPKR